jgi:hypothetical protein
MARMKATYLPVFVLLALSSFSYAQAVKVTVVPVESAEDFRSWLGKPVNATRAATPTAYPGNLKLLPIGRKTQLPILVTGLPLFPIDTKLIADVEILGAGGRSLGTSPGCCSAVIARASNESAVLLNSWVIVEPEPGRPSGSYTVRVSVTDGLEKWTTSQVLPYGETDMPGIANEVPRLKMNVPPAQQEPGGAGDKRDCLSLATPAEVIKCSEKKR